MNSNSGRGRGTVLLVLLVLWQCLVACSRPGDAAANAAPKPATGGAATQNAAPKAERYPLTGEIIRVDLEHKQLVVSHDEIKGYMPAMTMEFGVSSGDLALAKPGQRIRAELVPSETGDIRLEKIWPDDRAAAATRAPAALASATARSTVARRDRVMPILGTVAAA